MSERERERDTHTHTPEISVTVEVIFLVMLFEKSKALVHQQTLLPHLTAECLRHNNHLTLPITKDENLQSVNKTVGFRLVYVK
jgi:hypothetical protein